MKIKLSKKQWQQIGKDTGWIKTSKMAVDIALQQAMRAWKNNEKEAALELLRQFDSNLTIADLERAIHGVKPKFASCDEDIITMFIKAKKTNSKLRLEIIKRLEGYVDDPNVRKVLVKTEDSIFYHPSAKEPRDFVSSEPTLQELESVLNKTRLERRKKYETTDVEHTSARKISIKKLQALIDENNKEHDTRFSITGAYGQWELWDDISSSRMDAGSASDLYQTFVKYRFNEKYRVASKNRKKKMTLSKNQWQNIGKKTGWIKKAQFDNTFETWAFQQDISIVTSEDVAQAIKQFGFDWVGGEEDTKSVNLKDINEIITPEIWDLMKYETSQILLDRLRSINGK